MIDFVSHPFGVNLPSVVIALNRADGKEVWVGSNATGVVSVVDPATGVVVPAAEGFGWPYRVLFSPDTRTVMLPDLRREELRSWTAPRSASWLG